MINHKDRKTYALGDNGKESSLSVHSWLAQYEEEDDFLLRKASNSLLESSEE